MGLFSSKFRLRQRGANRRFQTEEAYQQSRAKLLAMIPQSIASFRTCGFTDQTPFRLRYHYHTNAKEKAAALAQHLLSMGYTADHGPCANENFFCVWGHASGIKVDEQTVLDWTSRMCEVGHEHDCKFDDWSTRIIVRIERDLSLEATARILSEVLEVPLKLSDGGIDKERPHYLGMAGSALYRLEDGPRLYDQDPEAVVDKPWPHYELRAHGIRSDGSTNKPHEALVARVQERIASDGRLRSALNQPEG